MILRKFTIPVITLTAVFMATDALSASCTSLGYQLVSDASGILNGKSISAQSPTTVDPTTGQLETWNEFHCTNGDLFKAGDGTPVDPPARRGTWSKDFQNRAVKYDYGPGQIYVWALFQNPTNANSLCWQGIFSSDAVATGDILGNIPGGVPGCPQ